MKVLFSSVDRLGRRAGDEGRISRDPLPAFFSFGDHCEQFWRRQGCLPFDVVHPAFPLPTTASPTLQGVLKEGVGEAVVACDMREPYLLLLLTVHANFCTHVVRAVGHALPLFCGDFLSICPCSVYESVGEVLKFTMAAAHKINVVSKS